MGTDRLATADTAGSPVQVWQTPEDHPERPSHRPPEGLKRTKGNPWVFPSPDTRRPPQSLYYPWHRIRCRAGLPDVRLHDLRHSFASFLVNQGVSIYVVQDLLGHTQIKTTQRYAHLTGEARQDAAEVASMVLQRANREEEA